jgi:FAD/FMN-containing dehydrogenase
MRRSYGDSVMNSLGGIIEMTGIDRFMALDLAAGTLQSEVGVTLSEIMRDVLSRSDSSFQCLGERVSSHSTVQSRDDRTMRLLSRLDMIVQEAGGRLHGAKDGRISKDMWAAGYPNLHRFMAHVDPAIASDFWRRVSP